MRNSFEGPTEKVEGKQEKRKRLLKKEAETIKTSTMGQKARNIAAAFLVMSLPSIAALSIAVGYDKLYPEDKVAQKQADNQRAEEEARIEKTINISPEAKEELKSENLELGHTHWRGRELKSSIKYEGFLRFPVLDLSDCSSVDISVREPNKEEVVKYLEEAKSERETNTLIDIAILLIPNKSRNLGITAAKGIVVGSNVADILSNPKTYEQVVGQMGKIIVVNMHMNDGSVRVQNLRGTTLL